MFTVDEVYNNISYDSKVTPDFGYSCFIEEPGILFDAGAKGDVLLNNLEAIGISADMIRYLVLSHDHWDHNGGVKDILAENSEIICYCPPDTSQETRSILEQGQDCISTGQWVEIVPDVFLTCPMKGVCGGSVIYEQSIVLRNSEGLFVITGCSHPHISNIVGEVRKKGDVFGVMGGFHDVNAEDIESLKGMRYIAPSHCTKDIEGISNAYPEEFCRCGAGFVHKI